MPMNRKNYPKDWEQISLKIRKEACWKCEFCGAEQGKPNPIKPNPMTGSKVILTVAHLDHNPQNNERANLRALCQRCHLIHDQQHHLENRRRRKLAAQEQQR